MLDDVVLAKLRADHALAAAALRAVKVNLGALGVSAVRNRDNDVFLGDEVFHADLAVERHNLAAPVVAVLVDDFFQLVADNAALATLVGQNRVELGDFGFDLLEFVERLLPLQRSEPAQLHVENRGCLHFVDVEQPHQSVSSFVGGRRIADQFDDGVELVERLDERAQDVRALFGLAQPVASAPDDDVDLVIDPVSDESVEGERAGHVIDERHHVAPEGVLQLCVLVKVGDDDLRHGVALEHDDESLPGARGRIVADIGDAR